MPSRNRNKAFELTPGVEHDRRVIVATSCVGKFEMSYIAPSFRLLTAIAVNLGCNSR